MNTHDVGTSYDRRQRCSNENLKKQIHDLYELPYLRQGLDATNSMILILNTCRQAVFANKAYLAMMNIQEISELMGQRPGEIIKCVHAYDGLDGCGTADACKYCNGMNTILTAMNSNKDSIGEFSHINTRHGYEQNLNLSIYVSPLKVKKEMFYVVSFANKNDSVGKRMLERTFFHDIINKAGALKGIVSLLKEDVPAIIKPEVEFVEEAFQSLVEDIQSQKYLTDAENKQLVLQLSRIHSCEQLQSVSKLYEGHDAARHKTITIDRGCINKELYTDQRLLRRILGNMVKNALEASDEGGIVTLGCNIDDEKNEWITFWVHNDNYMDERVQNFVFHRSFSTKGDGRGLGTYSMKLFGEKFLQGKVDFVSDTDKGTRFYIKLPLKTAVSE